MVEKHESSTMEKVASAAIVAAAVAFGFYRLRYGVCFKEEGLCLSTPVRFALGDVPFRDEVLVSLRWFEIWMTPVMRLLPGRGSVMALRQLSLVFHLACAGGLVYSVRRYLRPLSGVALFFAAAYANIFNYWSPTYHSAAFDFACAGLAFMVAGSRDERPPRAAAILGLLSGVALFMSWASELPMVALLAAPACVCAAEFARARGGPKRVLTTAPFVCCATAIITSLVLLAAAFAAISSAGLMGELVAAVKVMMTINVYGAGAWSRVFSILRDMGRAMPWFAFHTACWGMLFAGNSLAVRGRGVAGVFPVAAAALLYIAAPLWVLSAKSILIMFLMTDYYEGFCLMCFAAVPAVLFSRRVEWGAGGRRACTALFAAGVACHFALAVSAGSGALVGVVLTLPFFVVAFGMCAMAVLGRHAAGGARAAVLLCCLTASLFASNMYASSDHVWVWQFKGRYEDDRLKGIMHFAETTESTDALVDYLKPRLNRGDYLLSFYDNAMLNYLTDTRPAVETGLPNHLWPDEVRARFIRRMVERGRVPCYAVHLGPVDREPVYDFVRSNYVPVVRFGQYYVWRLRGAGDACR